MYTVMYAQNTMYSSQLGWHARCHRRERLGLSPSRIITEPPCPAGQGPVSLHLHDRQPQWRPSSTMSGNSGRRSRGFKSCHPNYCKPELKIDQALRLTGRKSITRDSPGSGSSRQGIKTGDSIWVGTMVRLSRGMPLAIGRDLGRTVG